MHAPFVLFYKCGVTRSLANLVCALVKQGLSIQGIETLLANRYWEEHRGRQILFQRRYTHIQESFQDFKPESSNLISNDLLSRIFLQTFLLNDMEYCRNMQSMLAKEWLSFDHTFKIASNIGYQRAGAWISQYTSCFFVLNEKGQIIGWQFTSRLSLEEVLPLLSGIYSRHVKAGIQLKYFCVDNCCQAKPMLHKIFGDNTIVLLDLFHAMQRISKTLSKKNEHYLSCLTDLSMVFRSIGDNADHRMMQTPSPHIIRKNLKAWVDKWSTLGGNTLISNAVINAVDNLLVHVDKGCLSGIPPGCGTNRNENLHKQMNTYFHASRVSILFAYALVSVLIYSHNNRMSFKGKSVVVHNHYGTQTGNFCDM